jgi:hypothetical protein
MKYLARANIYKASNVHFDATICEAYSYGWWRFVERIGGQIVFNWYAYSNTTIKHQWKVWRLLRDLGITIDAEIESPAGLQDLDSSLQLYAKRIERLEAAIAKPRSKKKKNEERRTAIESMKHKILLVKGLMRKNKRAA